MGASMATSGGMLPALHAALNEARSRRVWTAFAIASLRCSGVRVGGSWFFSSMSYILSTYPWMPFSTMTALTRRSSSAVAHSMITR